MPNSKYRGPISRAAQAVFALGLLAQAASARDYHVAAAGGDDRNEGSASSPLKTISAAARLAMPGDVITVHEGTYRERITPPRGGESDSRRIVYQGAPGETAIIKGSEIVRDWKPFMPGVWKATVPNSLFGSYNPYKDLIVGDWFTDKGRPHHTGEVYLNGKALFESNLIERVLHPQPYPDARDQAGSTYTWFAEVDKQNTYIYANFHDKDPNKELVEINVRDSCFYPDQTGRDYITIRNLRLSQAATQWAAPTAEQIGLIGTNWSKGWIIENNVVSDAKCTCITLGKDRKTGHNVWINDPSKGGADHYNEVIQRALAVGWSKEKIGSHIVRNNTIHDCDQAGIAGSLGAVFSTITGNHIYNVWAKRQFTGAEMAGIKLHAAIDVLIQHNWIHNAGRGIWMDWMAQGTRISGNLLHDNTTDDLFVEVDHGPFMVDNNLFLSENISLFDMSEGGAYAHNLMAGRVVTRQELRRQTPFHPAHATAVAGLSDIKGGDDRFYNNIFIGGKAADGYGLAAYDAREFPLQTGGNVYLNGARPYGRESNPVVLAGGTSKAGVMTVYRLNVSADPLTAVLQLTAMPDLQQAATMRVTSNLLGKARVPNLGYENADGSPLAIDTDYLGKKRSSSRPTPGPFENPGAGEVRFKLW
jgi:hypothetical protein